MISPCYINTLVHHLPLEPFLSVSSADLGKEICVVQSRGTQKKLMYFVN